MWVAAWYANDLRKICISNIYDNLGEERGLPLFLFLQQNETSGIETIVFMGKSSNEADI